MKKIDKSILKGSLVLLITFNIFNLLNFIFQMSMARLLTLAEFGVLTTLTYIIVIFAVFNESVQTIISRYSTDQKSPSKLKTLLDKSFKKATRTSFSVFLLYILIAIPLVYALKIPFSLLALTGLMLFPAIMIPITRGVLQGKKMFSPLGINMVFEGALKLILGIFLVSVGWGVYGALTGILLGTILAFALSFFPIRDIMRSKEIQTKLPNIYSYSKPVFIATFVIVLFLSVDIIIARMVFPPELVGAYAIASQIAKVIFIGTQPVGKAMFPISTSSKSKKDSEKTLKDATIITSTLILVALAAIIIFPGLLVWVFSGRVILESVWILLPLSIAIGLLSLTNLFILHKLSKSTIEKPSLLFVFILIQIALLSSFSSNLFEFSMALLVSSAIFLWGTMYLLRQ